MNFGEFVGWLRNLADQGRLTQRQVAELIQQRALFDNQRQFFESEFYGNVVGMCAGDWLTGHTVVELLETARERYGGDRKLRTG
jgi:hypothetical protein